MTRQIRGGAAGGGGATGGGADAGGGGAGGGVFIITIVPTGSDPARAVCAGVTFGTGARAACHMYPLGHTLVVTAEAGWAHWRGEPVEEIC